MLHHLTPAEALESLSRAAVNRATPPPPKLFASSFLAGMLMAFACGSVLVVNASPDLATYTPGLLRLLTGLVFPYGVVLAVLSGASLSTSCMATTAVAACQGRLRGGGVAYAVLLSLLGNIAGSLFVVHFLFGLGGTFEGRILRESAVGFATAKLAGVSWLQTFIRAVGANFLMGMGEFQAAMASSHVEKAAAMWAPAAAVVMFRLELVVAGATFVPLAMWLGAPQITITAYIARSMLPSLLGNYVGGALFTGTSLWYLHLSDAEPVAIDGKYWNGEQRPSNQIEVSISVPKRELPSPPSVFSLE